MAAGQPARARDVLGYSGDVLRCSSSDRGVVCLNLPTPPPPFPFSLLYNHLARRGGPAQVFPPLNDLLKLVR